MVEELHRLFHSLLRQKVYPVVYPVQKLVALRREVGFRSEFNRRLDKALQRWIEEITTVPPEVMEKYPGRALGEIAQELHLVPDLEPDLQVLRDLIMACAECEVWHFPVWFSRLVDALKREGLIS
jgi:hypothetical protein